MKLNVKCYHWPFIYASAVCHNLVIAFSQICRVSTAFLHDDKLFESSQVLSCCKVLVLSLTELQNPTPLPPSFPSHPCHYRKSCTPGKGIWSCSRNSIRNFKPWTDIETYQIWAAWWVTGNRVQCVSLQSTGGVPRCLCLAVSSGGAPVLCTGREWLKELIVIHPVYSSGKIAHPPAPGGNEKGRREDEERLSHHCDPCSCTHSKTRPWAANMVIISFSIG